MIKHASFAMIALFWVVMNALLWHSELGPGHDLASSVPAERVWGKILKAPDDSTLSINSKGKRLGYVRLRPNTTEAASAGKIASENEPEGMVRRLAEYRLEVEGSVMLEAVARSIRIGGEFAFDPELRWKRFSTEAFIRPITWQLNGNAESKEFWIERDDGETEWRRRIDFAELANPQAMLREVDSPVLSALLPESIGALPENLSGFGLGLEWEARFEWLRIGSSRVRIYRLESRLMDRHRIVVLVSRVGEILRVELPGEVKLINDALYAN